MIKKIPPHLHNYTLTDPIHTLTVNPLCFNWSWDLIMPVVIQKLCFLAFHYSLPSTRFMIGVGTVQNTAESLCRVDFITREFYKQVGQSDLPLLI